MFKTEQEDENYDSKYAISAKDTNPDLIKDFQAKLRQDSVQKLFEDYEFSANKEPEKESSTTGKATTIHLQTPKGCPLV